MTKISEERQLFERTTTAPAIGLGYALVTSVTLGLIKVHKLAMDENNLYLVDVGYNHVYVYDGSQVGHNEKYFWKFNIRENPQFRVEFVRKHLSVNVAVKDIPVFDPDFGIGNKGGWVTVTYDVRVVLCVQPYGVGNLHRASEPLRTIKEAVLKTARQILPYMKYQEALVASQAEELRKQLAQEELILSLGVTVEQVGIGEIEGSKTLAERLQQSFDRLQQAQDRIAIGNEFMKLDEDHFRKTLLADGGDKAIDYISRRDGAIVEALMLAGGKSLPHILSLAGPAAADIGPQPSLARSVFDHTLLQMGTDENPWPELQIPETENHTERLQWERRILEERIAPHLIHDRESETSFVIEILQDGKSRILSVLWYDKTKPPIVELDGQPTTSEYGFLRPNLFRYDKTTVWDIYWHTRLKLGLTTDGS